MLLAIGLGLALSYCLPAMHRAGGGVFSSLEFLQEVQSHKGGFLVGIPLALAAIAASFATTRVSSWLAIATGLGGMIFHIPAFGPMADTGRFVAWPLVLLSCAIAAELTSSLDPSLRVGRIAWAWMATLLFALALLAMLLLGNAGDRLPNELGSFARRQNIDHKPMLAVFWQALAAREEGWWTAIIYLGSAVLGLASNLVGRVAPPLARRLLGGVAGLALIGVPWSWVVASAPESAKYHWDFSIRIRVAILWTLCAALLCLGARGLALVHARVLPKEPLTSQ